MKLWFFFTFMLAQQSWANDTDRNPLLHGIISSMVPGFAVPLQQPANLSGFQQQVLANYKMLLQLVQQELMMLSLLTGAIIRGNLLFGQSNQQSTDPPSYPQGDPIIFGPPNVHSRPSPPKIQNNTGPTNLPPSDLLSDLASHPLSDPIIIGHHKVHMPPLDTLSDPLDDVANDPLSDPITIGHHKVHMIVTQHSSSESINKTTKTKVSQPLNKTLETNFKVNSSLSVLNTTISDLMYAPLVITNLTSHPAFPTPVSQSNKNTSSTASNGSSSYNNIPSPGQFNPLAGDKFHLSFSPQGHPSALSVPPVIDPLIFPVQYYKPEALPQTQSTSPGNFNPLAQASPSAFDNEQGW